MKRNKFTKIFTMLLCAVMVVIIFPITASADIGPKASVCITFKNMGDEPCYGTLLSEKASTGPSSAWDGNDETARHNGNNPHEAFDYETWNAFVEYEDVDGYYFLQEGWNVSEKKEIAWTYYPPNRFKILLYYPETETFVVSGIYERYAFDTYYTVDMNGVNIGSVEYDNELSTDERIDAYRSYNYRVEILSLVARILLTIAIEMIVALLFCFRNRKQLALLIGVNAVTQIILNVVLNIINYNSGQMAFVFFFVLLELAIFALEAVLYCIWMKKLSDKPKKSGFYVLYSFVANAVSFGSGLLIAMWLPGIF